MLVKNMTNSRLDVWVQGGKKKTLLAGEIVDLPNSFVETGAGKNLKKQNKIVVIEGKDLIESADDKKLKPKKK